MFYASELLKYLTLIVHQAPYVHSKETLINVSALQAKQTLPSFDLILLVIYLIHPVHFKTQLRFVKSF